MQGEQEKEMERRGELAGGLGDREGEKETGRIARERKKERSVLQEYREGESENTRDIGYFVMIERKVVSL